MKKITLALLLIGCSSNDLPQISENIVRQSHVNDPRTALYVDLVPRNSGGTVTNLAGGLGTTINRWTTSYIDEILIGDPTDINKWNSTGQNQLFETNDIQVLELDSSQVARFGPTEELLLGEGDGDPTVGPDITFTGDGSISAETDMILFLDANNDSTSDSLSIRQNGKTTGASTEVFTIAENGRQDWPDGTNPMRLFSPIQAIIGIDSDNNSADSTLLGVEFFKNGAATRMAKIMETDSGGGGALALGSVNVESDQILKACMSSDCSAFFFIREELTTSHFGLTYDDGGTNNGMIIDNEDSSPSGSDLIQLSFSGNADVTGETFVKFNDTLTIGSITAATATTVAYNTTSDARLKQNEKPLPNPIEILMKINMYEFEWKEDGNLGHGAYAQELQKVYPMAVSGDPSGDPRENPMGVDYSKLVPVLVASVQKINQDNELLKAQISALKEIIEKRNKRDWRRD